MVKKVSKLKKDLIFICSVCAKAFTHIKPDTLVGKLGPIPVQFCRPCFKKVMKHDHLALNDTRRKVA